MRKFLKSAAETILMALAAFTLMAVSVAWPFALVALGG